jgi:cell division septation protein DedD
MQDNQQLHLASLAITPDVFKTGNDTDVTNTGDDQLPGGSIESGSQTEIMDTANAEDARYTIQVGAFADSQNAIRRMSELESENLSAYTNGYRNKRDELRFNVRFGYFNNKSSALTALNSFQQNMSGSGYIVRIRRN